MEPRAAYGIRLITNQLAAMTLTLDFGAGPPRQEQARRVTLEAQPGKPDASDPTTPEDTAKTHFGAAELGCQGVRQGDEESSNLTSSGRCAPRASTQTKSKYDCHSQPHKQAQPVKYQAAEQRITYITCPPRRRLRNLPLYLYLHM
jgi:hypothetical protein